MKLQALTLLLLIVTLSCHQSKTNADGNADTNSGKQVKAWYGNIGLQGPEVDRYELSNSNGIIIDILDYGGTITSVRVPDKNGNIGDIVLGYDSLSGYLQKGNPYFGCLVGRYANRIANAKFSLNNQVYHLAANDHQNTLHGGMKGFDKVIWTVNSYSDSSLSLTYISKDGEEGFPGTLTATVIYTLTSSNELKIDYSASCDKTTPVNLTNHTYFNLSAGKDSTILDHELQLSASQYTAVNDQLIPTGIQLPVKNTAMDFTVAKRIGKDLDLVKGGYDHNWVLDKPADSLAKIGALYHPASGRLMEIFTTQPGIQFYSGNFLDGTLKGGKSGAVYIKHAGLALETQHFPDSPNQPSFPSVIVSPGKPYHQLTIYKFSVR